MIADLKRINFDVTPDQEEILSGAKDAFGASSVKDAVIRSAQTMLLLIGEVKKGKKIFTALPGEAPVEVIIPGMTQNTTWQWLVGRNHPWMKQMFLKGKKLRASTVYYDMIANGLSIAEAADNFSIPESAVNEAVKWCELNTDLLEAEANEEAIILQAALV
jgi:hypothetical protein